MFKKAFATRARSAVRESDRRRLRRDVEAAFGAPAGAGEVLDALLGKAATVEQLKITTSTGTQLNVYVAASGSDAAEPVVYQFDDGTLVPSCHLLLRCPTLLPGVLTHRPVWEEYVRAGADLMLPGVVWPAGGVQALGDFARGDLRCLWVVGMAAPVAVGRMALSSAELRDAAARGPRLKGKCLLVQHVQGDHLWLLGPKGLSAPVGPATPYAVNASAMDYDDDDDDDDDDDAGEDAGEDGDDNGGGNGDDRDRDGGNEMDNTGAPAKDADDKEGSDETAADSAAAAVGNLDVSSTPEPDMDTLLNAAFMLALRRQLKEQELPMLASTFYAKCILTHKPLGQTVDIKKSSFKKLGKFLAQFETDGLIKTVETKGVLSITAVNRQHPTYTAFRPSKWETAENETDSGSSAGAGAAASSTVAPAAAAGDPLVVELFKVPSAFASMMDEQGKSRDQYYTFAELRMIINDYVRLHNLVSQTDPRMVVLDPLLSDTLVRKEARSSTPEMARDVLANEFVAKQVAHYRVTPRDGSEPILRRGTIKPIQIVVEQRGGRKNVTMITNLETFAIDPEAFAKTLQKKLASSTSVTPLPGKNATGVCVLVQGHMASEVADLLTSTLAIPRKFVEANVKLK